MVPLPAAQWLTTFMVNLHRERDDEARYREACQAQIKQAELLRHGPMEPQFLLPERPY